MGNPVAARKPAQQLLAQGAGRTGHQQRAGGRRCSGQCGRAVGAPQGMERIEGHGAFYANFGFHLRR
ncbi:hypothetical protein GmRootV116_47900 [Variovorax sp. V116]